MTHTEYMRIWRKAHHEEVLEIQRRAGKKYYAKNKEKIRKYHQIHNQKHHEEKMMRQRKWRSENRDRFNEYTRARNAKNPLNLMMSNIVRHTLGGRVKVTKSQKYIGCSPGFLRNHLQSLFRPGMTWNNYGTVWVVDHIVPLSWWQVDRFPQHATEASHYTNLQPMFVQENLKKHARYVA